jgi:hypothetical protein
MASACPATRVAVNMAEAARKTHNSQRRAPSGGSGRVVSPGQLSGWNRPSGNSSTVSAASTAMPNSADSATTATGPKGSAPRWIR